MEVLLHQEALLTIMGFVQNLVAKVEALTPENPVPSTEQTRRRHSSSVSDVVEFIGKHAAKTGNVFRLFLLFGFVKRLSIY